MKLFHFYKSKKYLQRIVISISTFIFLLVTLFSYIVYINAQDIILGIQKDANTKVLSQIKYNVDYMNDVVRTIAISLYYDNDIIPLMTASRPNQVDLLTRRMKIDKFADYTPFIDSVIVYNGQMDKFIWGGSPELQNPQDVRYTQIRRLLDGERKMAKMQFFALKPDVFSIVNYDGASYEKGTSALFVNIETQWLFDTIQSINASAGQLNEGIVILDETGRMLDPAGKGIPDARWQDMIAKLPESDGAGAYYEYGSGKDKKLVSYMTIENNGWKIVSVVPLHTLTDKVEQLKTWSLLVTLAFLLVSVIAAIGVSHGLYRPVGKLFKTVKPPEDDVEPMKKGDELTYISTVYTQALEQVRMAQNQQISMRAIAGQYYLRKLITESQTIPEYQFEAYVKEHHLNIGLQGPFLLCILKLDNAGNQTIREKNLLHFALANIVQEFVSTLCRCEIAEMRQDHLIMLISLDEAEEDTHRILSLQFEQAQEAFERLYRVTFSLAISERIDSLRLLSQTYNELQQTLRYRFIFGHGAVILPDMIRDNNENRRSAISVEWEKKLVESIKVNNRDAFLKALDRIFQEIAGMHQDYMEYMMAHVLILIKNALKEMNQNRIHPMNVDISEANGKLLAAETLEECKKVLISVFEELADGLKQQDAGGRNEVLVEAVREMIEMKFTDVNLSLQEIAEAMRMSPAYIGKLFKKGYGMSVAEYMNDVRLRYSVQYLEENKYTINEIIEKVGFGNRSIFFRLFKHKYGTTPKEYRISKSITDI